MIKKIVFDLDGTLWQTSQSYIYAYHKVCQKYGMPKIFSDSQVLEYLGVKLNEVITGLFPESIDNINLAKDCLLYSIEYLKSHTDECCYPNIYEIIQKLSYQNELYIISNCPKEYVEAFFEISRTKEFFKGYYTIEDGDKKINLSKITNDYKDKIIFVGDDLEDYQSIINHQMVVFCYAAYGYKKAHLYDFKINSISEFLQVYFEINKKDEMLKNSLYEVISYNDTNITLIKKSQDLYYFGFVNNYNDDDLRVVLNKLEERKIKHIIGPINGNTWYSYRFAVDNFDFKLYPDCNNTQETFKIFESFGYKINQRYVSTLADINYKMWNRTKRISLSDEYKILKVYKDDCYKYLDDIYDVACDAFSDALYYENISKDDFINLYIENIKFTSPDMVLVFYKNELVAFNFLYGDLEKRFYVSKTTAIKKKHQHSLIILKLVDYSYQLLTENGYDKVLYHFQNDETKTTQVIFKNLKLKQKHYVMMEKYYE